MFHLDVENQGFSRDNSWTTPKMPQNPQKDNLQVQWHFAVWLRTQPHSMPGLVCHYSQPDDA